MILVDVQGVAYELDVPMSTLLSSCRRPVRRPLCITHLLVRDDAHLLYGFATDEERQLFRQLLQSQWRRRTNRARDTFRTFGAGVTSGCRVAGDRDGLQRFRVSARKTAERLMLELRGPVVWRRQRDVAGAAPTPRDDALRALLALGYNDKEARAALAKVESQTFQYRNRSVTHSSCCQSLPEQSL